MAQDREFYAFIVAPSAKSKLRKVRISYRLIYGALAAFGFIALVSTAAVLRLSQHALLQYELASIQSQNEQLQRENDTFRASYERLKGRITYVEDMSESLAREVKGESTAGEGAEVGQGGPELPDNIVIPDFDRRTEELERELRELADRYRDERLRLATIPSGWPAAGYLTDDFGNRRNPFGGGTEGHEGQDIAAPWGAPVRSTADGLVVHAAARNGYGNVVVIYHGNGVQTRYGHLSQIGVEAGQRVRRGEEIGRVGSTGRSTGPHCHYEVRENSVPVDPRRYQSAE
jgi:murein DD-endopeptidase MepM/ murein hydrolase activator NlpD